MTGADASPRRRCRGVPAEPRDRCVLWSRIPAASASAQAEREPRRMHLAEGRIRRREEARIATSRSSSASRGRISSGAPTAAHAATPARVASSCASLVATRESRRRAEPARRHPVRRTSRRGRRLPARRRGRRERPRVARVRGGRGVVPQRRDEAAVPAARAVAARSGLEDDDVERRLEPAELPGRPEPEIAAADYDDVRRRVAVERRCDSTGPASSSHHP